MIAVAIVDYYNQLSLNVETEYIAITNVNNFSEVTSQIEEYYGSDLESLKITLLDSGNYITLTENSYEKLMEGDIDAL